MIGASHPNPQGGGKLHWHRLGMKVEDLSGILKQIDTK
jgi:hypothetical protein